MLYARTDVELKLLAGSSQPNFFKRIFSISNKTDRLTKEIYYDGAVIKVKHCTKHYI